MSGPPFQLAVAVMRGRALTVAPGVVLPPAVPALAEISARIAELEKQFEPVLRAEVAQARMALRRSCRDVLPDYLIFGAGDIRREVAELGIEEVGGELPARNSKERARERHLLLYLQRLCGKNDTFSRFGPSTWGRLDETVTGVRFEPSAGIDERHLLLERWTAHLLARALNADPAARRQFCPRLHPNGRIEGNEFVFIEDNRRVPLSPALRELLDQCDGQTPAQGLEAGLPQLEELVDLGVLLLGAEVPALEANAFGVLVQDIAAWPAGEVRTGWLDRAERLGRLPAEFGASTAIAHRVTVMNEARRLLGELGETEALGQRALYKAANPILEECARFSQFHLGVEAAAALTREGRPWLDLWRDTYAFVASRLAQALRHLHQSAPRHDGAVAWPAFLAHCARQNMPLTGHGLVAPGHVAFQEVKGAFRRALEERAGEAEVELTAEDCAIVRRSFSFPAFDEYTYPSADLQIAARSFEAMARGEYQWIIAELHPAVALLHHGLFWSCPEKEVLAGALRATTFGQPSPHYGFHAADFTAHTTVHLMEALGEQSVFVAPQRGRPEWNPIPPAEVEVVVQEESGDVVLRQRGTGRHLGSLARNWLIPLGFHPFHFGRTPHMPRLRCGNVIVQRRSWTVKLEELAPGNHAGISPALVSAVESLRAEKGWPRHIYIRPTEQALRRSGAEGRDKDTKPVYVDLESYLFLEIFHRWLTKAGELEVTEMLPDPEHLCWQEPGGNHTFEIRTLIVPET